AVTGNPVDNVGCACNITTTFPNLVSPAHRTHMTDTTPSFTWSNVNGEDAYRIMIYTADNSFIYKKVVTTPNYTLPSTNALARGVSYQWRVRTRDANCGTWTGWSKRNTLFID